MDPNTLVSWARSTKKFRPSKELIVSPIKQIECNIRPECSNDYQKAFYWILSMTEQFYYDNSLILISNNFSDINALSMSLRKNYLPFSIKELEENWISWIQLGKGSFGEVFQFTDKTTNEIGAVKFLRDKSEGQNVTEHRKMLIRYFQERNYLIKCRESPFIVKFKYSFILHDIQGLFLVFEYCVCDLSFIIDWYNQLFKFKVKKLLYKKYLKGKLIKKIKSKSKKLNFDMEYILLIYTFELLAGLDFLAKCKVVHRDIKPQNILISSGFHIKYSDFGLITNTKFITDMKLVHLIDIHDETAMKNFDKTSVNICGTRLFYDLEMLAGFIYLTNIYLYKRLKRFNAFERLEFKGPDDKRFDANFLSDLWAIGLTIIEMYFGKLWADDQTVPKSFKKNLKWIDGVKYTFYNKINLFNGKESFTLYAKDGLKNAFGKKEYLDFYEFLSSLFLPRSLRGKHFLKSESVLVGGTIQSMQAIDITKVEKILIFSKNNINCDNVHFLLIPSLFKELITSNRSKQLSTEVNRFRNGSELIRYIRKKYSTSNKFHNVIPGINFRT